jgi:hypothetical protein
LRHKNDMRHWALNSRISGYSHIWYETTQIWWVAEMGGLSWPFGRYVNGWDQNKTVPLCGDT